MIKAIVGAGGKTSLIKRYVEKYRAQGLKVFVTTSTHMFIEENTLLTDDADDILQQIFNCVKIDAITMTMEEGD